MNTNEQSPAPVAGDEIFRPASEQPVEAIDAGREVRTVIVKAIAFLNRDVGTDRLTNTVAQLLPEFEKADALLRAATAAPKAWYIESKATPGECWELIEGREPTEYIGEDSFTITPLYALAALSPAPPARTPMGGEVEALREALEPFAAVADEYDDREDDTFEVWMDAGPVMVRDIREALRLSAFRRARQALAASSPSPAQGGGVEALIADIDAEMEGRTRGYADKRGELLFRCRDALSASPQPEAGEEDPSHHQVWTQERGWEHPTPPSVQPVEGEPVARGA